MSWSEYKNIIGFVMQRDIFFESLKVNEIFRLVVDLTSDDKSDEWKNGFLKDIVKNLKMERAQNTQVGGDLLKGISGGEKRRLNIGFELLRKPRILFLDEPTSGLDSYTSYIIIRLLKKLAR